MSHFCQVQRAKKKKHDLKMISSQLSILLSHHQKKKKKDKVKDTDKHGLLLKQRWEIEQPFSLTHSFTAERGNKTFDITATLRHDPPSLHEM